VTLYNLVHGYHPTEEHTAFISSLRRTWECP